MYGISGTRGIIRYYQVREKDPDTLLLNAGDYYQGTMWYTFFKYRPVIQVAPYYKTKNHTKTPQKNISMFSVFQRAELHSDGTWKPRLWWWHLRSPALCQPGDFKLKMQRFKIEKNLKIWHLSSSVLCRLQIFDSLVKSCTIFQNPGKKVLTPKVRRQVFFWQIITPLSSRLPCHVFGTCVLIEYQYENKLRWTIN